MIGRYFDTGAITADGNDIIYELFAALTRNAKCLYVINDGPGKMFVQIYMDMKPSRKLWLNAECWIYPRQRRCFHNVYKILIGKTSMENQYRITECEPTKILK